MSTRWTPERVFVHRHPVDMRKRIDERSAMPIVQPSVAASGSGVPLTVSRRKSSAEAGSGSSR